MDFKKILVSSSNLDKVHIATLLTRNVPDCDRADAQFGPGTGGPVWPPVKMSLCYVLLCYVYCIIYWIEGLGQKG